MSKPINIFLVVCIQIEHCVMYCQIVQQKINEQVVSFLAAFS
jgi:hypothetical protein